MSSIVEVFPTITKTTILEIPMRQPLLGRIRSFGGRVAREAIAHYQSKTMAGSPTVAILLNGRYGSNLLRGMQVAEELRGIGWRAVIVPGNLRLDQRSRVLRSLAPDVLIIKGSRHALNRRELFDGYPYVVDLDDADFYDPAHTEVLADLARGSSGFIAGSRFIKDWATQFCDDAEIIWTGTRPSVSNHTSHIEREPILTWAQLEPVAYGFERAFVTEVLDRVLEHLPRLRLRLYGRKPGEDVSALTGLLRPEIDLEWRPLMPYDDFLRSLRETAIGLSPVIIENDFSRGKSFGKVLGYLDAKVPVICSDEVDHGLFFRPETGIVSNDPNVWADGIVSLLSDPVRRQVMADAAYEDFLRQLSNRAAVSRTADYLHHVIAKSYVCMH